MGAITGMLGVGGQAGGTGFGGPQMSDQTGMNNLQTSFQQLQQVAAGNGPNPAMAQYNQNIQNLAKQQSGAISSIQGISPALAARLTSQQGSAAMQNAAAQGATTQAEQQLGAMGQMGNVAGMQQGAANQMQGNINTTNAGLATQTMQNQMGFIGGLFGGAGAAMGKGGGAAAAAEGGEAGVDFGPSRQIQGGGMSLTAAPPAAPTQDQTTQSLLSKFLSGDLPYGNQPLSGPAALQKGMTKFGAAFQAGPSPAAAPQDQSDSFPSAYNPGMMPSGNPLPNPAEQLARGGAVRDFRSGGNVRANGPAQKAVKRGNSYANDKIPAVLSEGEVVIPRNIMQAPNPVKASADFVANVIAKRRGRK